MEYQPVPKAAPEKNDDVSGTINIGEARQESEQADISLPHMENVGGNSEGNNEEEEEDVEREDK